MRLWLIGVLSVCLSTSAALVSVGAAQQPQEPAGDNAGQIRMLQKERVKVLQQLVAVHIEHYKQGIVDFPKIADAQDALVNAQLELTDKPEERIALLKTQLEASENILKIAEEKSKMGMGSQADMLRAKAHCLDIKIRLLQEHSRQAPPLDQTEE
jgi:outer membrane protein TolC